MCVIFYIAHLGVRYDIYTLAFPFDLRCQSGILLNYYMLHCRQCLLNRHAIVLWIFCPFEHCVSRECSCSIFYQWNTQYSTRNTWYTMFKWTKNPRDAPNMLKNLPIIPSKIFPYYSLKYHLLFPNYSTLTVRK